MMSIWVKVVLISILIGIGIGSFLVLEALRRKNKKQLLYRIATDPDTQQTLIWQEEQENFTSYLRIHISEKGAIFLINVDDNTQSWISRKQLENELQQLKEKQGFIIYSRENPDQLPAPIVEEIFKEILSYHLPLKLATPTEETQLH